MEAEARRLLSGQVSLHELIMTQGLWRVRWRGEARAWQESGGVGMKFLVGRSGTQTGSSISQTRTGAGARRPGRGGGGLGGRRGGAGAAGAGRPAAGVPG